MAWGISPNASKKEKIKAEMNEYLMGQKSCGIIDYATYSEIYDFTMELLDKMYEQGVNDSKKDNNSIDVESNETIEKNEVIDMMKDMQLETAKCNGFFAGHVTQIWVIRELLGKRIERLGGEPYIVEDSRLVIKGDNRDGNNQ